MPQIVVDHSMGPSEIGYSLPHHAAEVGLWRDLEIEHHIRIGHPLLDISQERLRRNARR